ncbi:hypothetical protein F4823DRAFT_634828 [Ustulina deusta]|nr:hypothetical protein F4823DRAFT_634828 [Ustulina deusta]
MNTAHHDKLKTKLACGYSGKDIPIIESDVDEQLGILYLAFGKAFGNLEEGVDLHEFEEFAKVPSMKGSTFSEIPWLGDIFFYPPILRLVGPKVTDKKGLGMFMRLVVLTYYCVTPLSFQGSATD